MNLVPRILAHDDPFEDFGEFFVALKPDSITSDDEPKALTFAQHQKAFILPQFSDEEFSMTKYLTGDLMKSDLGPFTIQAILNRFKEKDP